MISKINPKVYRGRVIIERTLKAVGALLEAEYEVQAEQLPAKKQEVVTPAQHVCEFKQEPDNCHEACRAGVSHRPRGKVSAERVATNGNQTNKSKLPNRAQVHNRADEGLNKLSQSGQILLERETDQSNAPKKAQVVNLEPLLTPQDAAELRSIDRRWKVRVNKLLYDAHELEKIEIERLEKICQVLADAKKSKDAAEYEKLKRHLDESQLQHTKNLQSMKQKFPRTELLQLGYKDNVYLIAVIDEDMPAKFRNRLQLVMRVFGVRSVDGLPMFHNKGIIDGFAPTVMQAGGPQFMERMLALESCEAGAHDMEVKDMYTCRTRHFCDPMKLQDVLSHLLKKGYFVLHIGYSIKPKELLELEPEQQRNHKRLVRHLLSIPGIRRVYDNVKHVKEGAVADKAK